MGSTLHGLDNIKCNWNRINAYTLAKFIFELKKKTELKTVFGVKYLLPFSAYMWNQNNETK